MERFIGPVCAVALVVAWLMTFVTIENATVTQDDAHFAQAAQTLLEEGRPYLRFNLYSTVQTRAPYGLLAFGPTAIAQTLFGISPWSSKIFGWFFLALGVALYFRWLRSLGVAKAEAWLVTAWLGTSWGIYREAHSARPEAIAFLWVVMSFLVVPRQDRHQ